MTPQVLTGTVVHGVQVGSPFGIATANLHFDTHPDIPEGVYLVSILQEDGTPAQGLLHFGARKTFDSTFSAEVHILDFNRDIYGQKLKITLEVFLRAVQKFQNADALFTQIEKDIIHARKYFLRQDIAQQWQQISDSDKKKLAAKALTTLQQEDCFLNAPVIFGFAPMKDELSFFQLLCSHTPKKTFAWPRVVEDQIIFHICKWEDLSTGYQHILEPPSKTPIITPKPEDLLVVPARAGSPDGYRIGRGKGFYDRYLSTLDPKPQTLMVLPDFAVRKNIPHEPHDQKIQTILSITL